MTLPWQHNNEILDILNSKISGHIEAKKSLITALNRSYIRSQQIHLLKKDPKECISNRNVLLIGDSGTGKTAMVEELQNIMNFPLKVISATELAPTSASGLTVDKLVEYIQEHASLLSKLLPKKYKSKEEVISRYVIFIDEIDKLSKRYDGNQAGNWNQHTQAMFLKLFENGDALQNVTFIFAGAFTGMLESYEKDKTKPLGFIPNKDDLKTEIDYEELIVKYGLLPELVGRIHATVALDVLTYKDYEKILNDIILPKKRKELEHFGEYGFDLYAVEKDIFIKKAIKSGQGVRSLIKSIDRLLQRYEFSCDILNISDEPTGEEHE